MKQKQQYYNNNANNNNANNNNNGNNANNNKKNIKSNNSNINNSLKASISPSTVSESTRISLTQKLNEIRNDEIESYTFPSTLNNIERKFLHNLAEKLGLSSKSSGKGDARAITVRKRSEKSPVDDKIIVFDMKIESEMILKNSFLNNNNDFFDSSLALEKPKDTNTIQFDKPNSLAQDAELIRNAYMKAQSDSNFITQQSKKKLLPAHAHEESVCKLIKENQVILVSGETGCGKTTQIPQFLLNDASIGPNCRMIITQPRRLSAMSVAARISEEIGEKLGQTVGYNIRMESQKCASTQILVVTPGLLLRKLQSDNFLEEYSHVIIDEAHEQDRFTEFLLIILRDVCSKRKDLKLILMSATMHTNKLSSYFNNCPHISMGGSNYPVTEFFLEDALKVTDFLKGKSVGKNEIITDIMKKSYTCPSCNFSAGSPEELGTHVAFCSVTNTKPRNHIESKGSTKSDLNNLVRQLEAAAILSIERKNGETEQDRLKKIEAIMKGTKSEVVVDSNNEEDAEESDDIDIDGDNYEEEEDEDDDVAVGIEKTIAPKSETNTATAAALQQYHRIFDDEQIDYDLIFELLKYVFKSEFIGDGSVLVFLPGWDDISRMSKILAGSAEFGNHHFKLIQLHSGIPKAEQNAVFQKMKKGEHKIILSTNIAETSLTIEDVTVVINSGKMKEKEYDPYLKLTFLKSSWVSKASARQRKGRAGRVRAGVCFHLCSKQRFDSLPEFQTSELLRMPLEELVLQTKQLGLAPGRCMEHNSVQGFLGKALNPPHHLSITNAVELLTAINCLDDNESLTIIGDAISKLPCDPRVGRMMILGCIFGVSRAVVFLSSAMNYRDPFIMPTNDQQRVEVSKIKQMLSKNLSSDQFALLKAIEGFDQQMKRNNSSNAYRFCEQHHISKSTMNYIYNLISQLSETMKESGIYVNSHHNQRNNNNAALITSIIAMNLYPDYGLREFDKKLFATEKGRKAKVHPSSVNSKSTIYKQLCSSPVEAIVYQDLISINNNEIPGSGLAMLNTTPLSIFALLLTASSIEDLSLSPIDDEEDKNEDKYIKIELDQWLQMKIKKSVYESIMSARKLLTAAMHEFIIDSERFSKWKYASLIDSIIQVLVIEQPTSSK